ncbi:MAG: acetyl-CoA C-acyltransferase [Vulcanimicrobiaceae bacterium]|jgi:acetyl-CoA C-acetyltransferase
MNGKAVVLAATRTPFGRLGGALSSLAATTLGAEAIRGALERAKVDRADVDHVIMGQVLQGGAGQAPARQASYKAGLAKTVTSETLNKVCASGMLAVAAAARLIDSGDYRLIVAGGMESMSNAPYALPGARSGYRFGDGKLVDLMIHDGLWDFFFDVTMASQGAKVAAELGLTREMQDEFAYQSHLRATQAQAAGHFAAEIVPIRVATKQKGKIVVEQVPTRVPARVPVMAGGNGSSNVWSHVPPDTMVPDPQKYSPYLDAHAHGEIPSTLVDRDEAVRTDASMAAMAKLPPIDKDGSVTAGNAPGVNDGAAALVLADPAYAKSHFGAEVLATIVDHATAAWDPPYLALTPAMAIQKLLDQQGLSRNDIAVWEINEAFSAVVLSSSQRLGLGSDKVNLQGGAVAMGHPIGASGARIVGTVIHQLRRRGGGLGIAAICSGGGQGDAILIRVD